jgi:heme exporter protein A
VRGFYAGMRRRLALARLFLRPPKLLLLDEPYAAFDAQGIAMVNRFARQVVSSGGSSIIVTHDLERARGTVDRVLHIDDGRIFTGATQDQVSPDDHHALSAGERA